MQSLIEKEKFLPPAPPVVKAPIIGLQKKITPPPVLSNVVEKKNGIVVDEKNPKGILKNKPAPLSKAFTGNVMERFP